MLDLRLIQEFYRTYPQKVARAKEKLGRPMTLSEKILFAHMDLHRLERLPEQGNSLILLHPDRVAMQDATAQMALLQFMLAGKDTVAVPTTVHCDHLIRAHSGAEEDLMTALGENKEVYDFLKSCSERYGIGFWKPGSGIIHQVVLENYAFPGGLMIGTDSHTPNAGGLGMVAIGVGGADAVDVMVGMPWQLKMPKLLGVHLKGKLSGWAAPKDVILKLAGILTVKGGTGYIIEYFGEGARSISCTGKATITNMGAEVGATTSLFPFDGKMSAYLKATHRQPVAELAYSVRQHLAADSEVEQDPERYFDRVIEIDLSKLEPQVAGPHSPDRCRSISELAREVLLEKKYPENIRVALIGSCTNSSYEDIARAASVAREARKHGLKAKVPFLITPGSEKIFATIQRDGFLQELEAIGGKVLANACGPCIGQWKRDDIQKGEKNVIVTSFNRNFPGRNDANPETLSFIASPELVTAFALAGKLTFNPLQDSIEKNRERIQLRLPHGEELPAGGFAKEQAGFVPPRPLNERKGIEVIIRPDSERLEKLKPFSPWNGKDFEECLVLWKAKGKCTTDHISPAGKWLKYRGHLSNISRNFFTAGKNAFTGEYGKAINIFTREKKTAYEVALDYKKAGKPWVIVGDENYGEGSSREHAAMEPRFLGCVAVIAKSFARIHETNLKKQGILPLTFANKEDYDRIEQDTRISLMGLKELAPRKPVKAFLHFPDGRKEEIELHHSLWPEEINWFQAGSALNYLRSRKGD